VKAKKTIVKLVKFILLITGSILILLSLFLLLKGDFFKIDQVICYDKDNPCQTDLWLRVNGLVLGKNIILLSPQQVEEQIKDALPEVNQVEIEKKLLHKLVVHLTMRKAMAVIEANNNYYQVDEQGFILAKLDQPTDLTLIASGELSIAADNHQLESPPVLASLDFLYQLLMRNMATRRIEIVNSRELTVFLKTGPKAQISLEKSLEKQVGSLQLILDRAKMEGKQIQLIDLRFDKPVISYFER